MSSQPSGINLNLFTIAYSKIHIHTPFTPGFRWLLTFTDLYWLFSKFVFKKSIAVRTTPCAVTLAKFALCLGMMDLAESCASIAPNTAAKPVWIHTVKSTSGKRINCCLSWRGSCRNRLFSSYSDSHSYIIFIQCTFQLSINSFLQSNMCSSYFW